VQTARMAGSLSRRKSAMVLKSGIKRPVSHISSMLRRMIARASRGFRHDALEGRSQTLPHPFRSLSCRSR
jgi:hypothetical protein